MSSSPPPPPSEEWIAKANAHEAATEHDTDCDNRSMCRLAETMLGLKEGGFTVDEVKRLVDDAFAEFEKQSEERDRDDAESEEGDASIDLESTDDSA
ncbi:hypothetical protein CMEL01_16751 [Colletotrichum melonis]|uniref:Uncharacterized protein n=1 Tax=Colletotrichum melonis TaxID=1209925 RepID=A0AAI9U6C1_9PEZI|nr:hypothetical protein CMEL01_16751 [Colletotrichum melonis]